MLKVASNDDFLAECRLFPNGTYDDQVDAASRGFNALLQAGTFT